MTARTSLRISAVLVAATLGLAGGLIADTPTWANAPTGITVNSLSDTDANSACTISTVTTPAASTSLRNAVCVANNRGGTAVITVGLTGVILLSSANGPLPVGMQTGANISLVAQFPGQTTVQGDRSNQIFDLDPNQVGGVSVSMSGLTLKDGGGASAVGGPTFGGGAIIGGSGLAAVGDTLVLQNMVMADNTANAADATATNTPGGAVQFIGGNLSISGSTFSGNSSSGSAGGALQYQSTGVAGEGLSITGSTFTSNSVSESNPGNGGGAVVVDDPTGSATLSIADSTFSSNSAAGSLANPAHGGALWLRSGTLSVKRSTFVSNAMTGPAAGAAIEVAGGTLSANYNRIVGSSGGAGLFVAGGTAAAPDNWWGCPTGAGTVNCDTSKPTGATTVEPHLTLVLSASPAVVVAPATSTTLTASVLVDSAGTTIDSSNLTAFNGLTVAFTQPLPAGTTVTSPGTISAGSATSTYQANGATGPGLVSATLDETAVTTAVSISASPIITSANQATVRVGASTSTTITASGYPLPTVSLTGATVPSGLEFVANSDGTGTLSGAAVAGTAGDYSFTIKAVNTGGSILQSFVLHVVEQPAITSASTAAFATQTASSFTVTTTGTPTPLTLSEVGALPTGLSFINNGNGTASISGTPTAHSGGQYSIEIGVTNGVGTDASQTLVLTVAQPAAFSSAASVTFREGSAGSFTATTAQGFPAANTIVKTGSLPTGVKLTDNGDGTATLAGTPAHGTAGTYVLTLSADNGFTPVPTQTFTLSVQSAPAIVLAAAPQTVNAGNTASFTASASGFPAPTVQWSVSTNGGTSFTPIQGETDPTLNITAVQADDGNLYRAVFSNAVLAATTTALLTVRTSPTVSSAASAGFEADGTTQTFPVTTAGTPNAALTVTGAALPAWLTFHDNGDGTATLTGTPVSGDFGPVRFTINAINGFAPAASQVFTLTVSQAPALTGAISATFPAKQASSLLITATGYPAPAISALGLPSGVHLVDNHDGTATLSGTPPAGAGGVTPIRITASNGVLPNATESFELTVTEEPSITSASTSGFLRGVPASFIVMTGAAFPTAVTLTETGALPTGLSFVDQHDGTAIIAGSTMDAAGTATIRVTATNGSGQPSIQTLAIVVQATAAILLPVLLTTSGGSLSGVPSTAVPLQIIHVSTAGFAPGAPVTFGIYSTPMFLALVDADLTGSASATLTIPAGFSGAHTIVAAGVGADGSALYLRSALTVTATGSGASAAPTIARTGPGEDVLQASLVALVALLGGIVVLLRRRRQRKTNRA